MGYIKKIEKICLNRKDMKHCGAMRIDFNGKLIIKEDELNVRDDRSMFRLYKIT